MTPRITPWPKIIDASAVRDQEWTLRARCRGSDPELFFPLRHHGPRTRQSRQLVRDAQAVCERCPVTFQCLSRAIAFHVEDGIWGGVVFDVNRRLSRDEMSS